MKAMRAAGGTGGVGPRGGRFKMVGGKKVYEKRGATKPASKPGHVEQHLDKKITAQKTQFSALVKAHPDAAMRAVGKAGAKAQGTESFHDRLRRGLAKLMGM